MDSLFEAVESLGDTLAAQLPDWLGDDPEEQEAHVHTRQARWEVLAAEVGAGELDGSGDSWRRPQSPTHEEDLSPDALSPSHQVYGVSSLPPRPLPADAEERAARLKASAAAAAAAAAAQRGAASPSAGSSTPTGSSWASRPPPGSPAARIERARLLTQFRNEQRGVTMLCGDGSSMEVAFLQKGSLEPNCLYITLALAFPYVPPTLALATRVAHPWVQAASVAAPSGTAGDAAGSLRCGISSPGLRAWDPATSTLGGVVRDVLAQLGATSRMTGEVVTLDRLDAEEAPMDGDGRGAEVQLAHMRSEEEAEAEDAWVPDELRDVAAALSDVAALLGGEGEGGTQAEPDEATVLRSQKSMAAAALANSMAARQPAGWDDDEEEDRGAPPGDGDGGSSSGEERVQPPPPPLPKAVATHISPLRRPLIKPPQSPGSPGSVAALTAMLSSSPPPLAAQTRLEAVRVLDSALLDFPSASPSPLPTPSATPAKQAPPPALPPRRTQFLVPKRRRGDNSTSGASASQVAMVETSDCGVDDSDAGGATSAAGDVSSDDERQAAARHRGAGASTAPSSAAPPASGAARLRDTARRLVTTLGPATGMAAVKAAQRFATGAASRTSLAVSLLAVTWLLAAAVAASARATLPHAGLSACALIAALPPGHPSLAAAGAGSHPHTLSLVVLPPGHTTRDVAAVWASRVGIAACSASVDGTDGALRDGTRSFWAGCTPPALAVATPRSWRRPFRVTSTFTREGVLVLGALSATSPGAGTAARRGRLLTHLRAAGDTSPACPAAVATGAFGMSRLAGASPAGLALLAGGKASSTSGGGRTPSGGAHVAAVLRALSPSASADVATWTGPLRGMLLCTASPLHTAAAAGASAEAVDVLLRTLHATAQQHRGALTATLQRGLRCGPVLLPALYSDTPLGIAARRRQGPIVDALTEALAASTASQGARGSAAALAQGAVYGPLGLVTSLSPAALALMAHHQHGQQGDTPPGQLLTSLLTAHGGADGRLTRVGVAFGPWSLLGHVTPLGLALLHGDAASVASLLRLGAQHAQRGACASVLLIPSGLTSCASLAALGDKSLPPLLAAWDEHVALEAADRMRLLMDVAIGGGSGGESDAFAPNGEQAAPPPRSREEVLLQAELEAQEEADLVLRVTASLARAKQTLASVGGSDTSAGKGGQPADGDVTSVEALEATAAQLVNARRGAERAAAEVMAAAARLAAESAAEEAAARRQAAQLAAYNARLSRQQARDMVAAEDEDEVAATGAPDGFFDAGDLDADLGTQLGSLAAYDDDEL